ncbi:outer membrane beta-barrel protein [Flavihumibacter petaseus]|nr:outer membrane beta-barrel protein [Flavihumibacter petaseus]
MKRFFPLLVIAVFSQLSLSAQQTTHPPRFYVELSTGPSFPIGNFKVKDNIALSDYDEGKLSGGALPGLQGNLKVGAWLDGNWKLFIQGGYSYHQQDEDAVTETLNDPNIQDASVAVDIKTDKWRSYQGLGGVTYHAPFYEGSRLAYEATMAIGIDRSIRPAVSFTAVDQYGTRTPVNYAETKMPAAFAWDVAFGISYRVAYNIDILGNINYYNAYPKRKSGEPEQKYEMAVLQVLLGLGFSF